MGYGLRSTAMAALWLALASGAYAQGGAPKPTGDAAPAAFKGTVARAGLMRVNVDADGGRVLVTLPAPQADGIAARYLYTPMLRSGLGAAPAVLDRGRIGDTQLLVFRRIGKKIAIEFENPRFRVPNAPGARSPDFATSLVWMGDIAHVAADGAITVDITSFLAADILGIARALGQEGDVFGTGSGPQGAGRGFRLDPALSAVDAGSTKVFPGNVEIDAIQTYVSDQPGDEVANIAPDPRRVTLGVHHSFMALPPPGFRPRPLDHDLFGSIGCEQREIGFGHAAPREKPPAAPGAVEPRRRDRTREKRQGGGRTAAGNDNLAHPTRALIPRSHSIWNGVSKDAPGGSGGIWNILRDAAARLLRMKAEGSRCPVRIQIAGIAQLRRQPLAHRP